MSNDLMQKLALSKAIMDKHNQIKRGQVTSDQPNISTPEIQTFDTPHASYNIPREFVSENTTSVNKTSQPMSKDLIMNSKLPDEIKRLMIENPITPTNPLVNSGSVLSDELIEKATKLMNTNKQPSSQPTPKNTTLNSDTNLKKVVKEVVEEVLRENGLIAESTSKSNESISIRVGQHVFEGKISKIKKLA